MARILSTNANAAIDAIAQRTFWLIDVTLPAFGSYSSETRYFSTQAVSYNSHNYEPILSGKPQIKRSLDGASDGGSFKLNNTDFEMSRLFLSKDRSVEGATVLIRFGIKLANGTIEADENFHGVVTSVKLSMADNGVTVTFVRDLENPNNTLGNFPLTQRCLHKFNANGTLSASNSACGWQTSQGGNAAFCDKTEDGADGCAAHNNLHRIGAIPFFANVRIEVAASDGTSSSGFDINPKDIDVIYGG